MRPPGSRVVVWWHAVGPDGKHRAAFGGHGPTELSHRVAGTRLRELREQSHPQPEHVSTQNFRREVAAEPAVHAPATVADVVLKGRPDGSVRADRVDE